MNHLSKMWGRGTKLRGRLGLRDEKWGLTPGEWPEGISSQRYQFKPWSQWLGVPLLQRTAETHTQWSPSEIQRSIYTDQEKGNLPILLVLCGWPSNPLVGKASLSHVAWIPRSWCISDCQTASRHEQLPGKPAKVIAPMLQFKKQPVRERCHVTVLM